MQNCTKVKIDNQQCPCVTTPRQCYYFLPNQGLPNQGSLYEWKSHWDHYTFKFYQTLTIPAKYLSNVISLWSSSALSKHRHWWLLFVSTNVQQMEDGPLILENRMTSYIASNQILVTFSDVIWLLKSIATRPNICVSGDILCVPNLMIIDP
jgi:hypothetical protein